MTSHANSLQNRKILDKVSTAENARNNASNSTIHLELEKFNNEFVELMDSKNPSAVSIVSFIRQRLRQFNLLTYYTEVEILIEAYNRACQLITHGDGVKISNPRAWVRRTSYNIIREFSRKRRRFIQVDDSVLEDKVSLDYNDGLDLSDDFSLLKKSFDYLDDDERKLLRLRIVDELSWEKIREVLSFEGKEFTSSALRKRNQRTLEKLRRSYHTLRQLSSLNKENY